MSEWGARGLVGDLACRMIAAKYKRTLEVKKHKDSADTNSCRLLESSAEYVGSVIYR